MINYEENDAEAWGRKVTNEPEVDKNEDVVLTVDEFARIMRMSSRSVRRGIKQAKIRKIEGLGRLVRIHPSEIARLARLNEL